MNFRYVMGGSGLVCAAWGGWLFLQQPEPWRIAAWLGERSWCTTGSSRPS